MGSEPWLYWHPHIGKFGVPPTNEAMRNVFILDWIGMYDAYTGDDG